MKFTACMVLIFLLGSANAQTTGPKPKKDDKTRLFVASYDQVWNACIASASNNFVIDHSEKGSGSFTFRTGISFTSAGFSVGVLLKDMGDGAVRVQLNTQAKGLGNWGAGGRIAKKFFAGVDKALKEP